MGKRGPRPQPTVLKTLRGTIRTPDRRRGPDALAPAGRPEPPDYFTPRMRERWAEILLQAPLNVLRAIDAAMLTDFVVNEALAAQAFAECGGRLTIETERGTVRNPLLLVYHKAVEAKRAAADRLGFSPSARVGLRLAETTDGDGDMMTLSDGTRVNRWARLEELRQKSLADNQQDRQQARRKRAKAKIETAALAETPPEGEA
jgi:phage terminase small subunit